MQRRESNATEGDAKQADLVQKERKKKQQYYRDKYAVRSHKNWNKYN